MRVAIWDRPTRLFHWLIVALVPALWWTAEEELVEIHLILGRIMLGLVLFRLLWGLVGSSTARFSAFVKGPAAIAAFLRGRLGFVVGHNPLGALSVVALLLALAVQVGLGLFASDEDGLHPGPLAHLVGADAVEEITGLHDTMFDVLLVLIGLHVAALLFHAWFKHHDLVSPMVTGGAEAPEGTEPMRPAPAWRFVAAAAGAALIAWGIGAVF